jgi:hypothetical protein
MTSLVGIWPLWVVMMMAMVMMTIGSNADANGDHLSLDMLKISLHVFAKILI